MLVHEIQLDTRLMLPDAAATKTAGMARQCIWPSASRWRARLVQAECVLIFSQCERSHREVDAKTLRLFWSFLINHGLFENRRLAADLHRPMLINCGFGVNAAAGESR
jgi:hypothetical protein